MSGQRELPVGARVLTAVEMNRIHFATDRKSDVVPPARVSVARK